MNNCSEAVTPTHPPVRVSNRIVGSGLSQSSSKTIDTVFVIFNALVIGPGLLRLRHAHLLELRLPQSSEHRACLQPNHALAR